LSRSVADDSWPCQHVSERYSAAREGGRRSWPGYVGPCTLADRDRSAVGRCLLEPVRGTP